MLTDLSAIRASVERVESILDSVQQITQFVRNFRRDNEKIAAWYNDTICGYLAHRGWFVAGSLASSHYLMLKEAIEKDEEAKVEGFMISHVRAIIEQTASEAKAKWPCRRTILADAFDAHSKALYTLSVPVLLSQADGMALEILDAHLFTDHSGKIGTKAEAILEGEAEQRPLAKSFLGLLINGLLNDAPGLRQRTVDRDQQKNAGFPVSPLNRHGVLHGIDCDYPVEHNSLRTIALINYLNWVRAIMLENDGSK